MAQRPTFPSPYLNTIDADENNEFSCLISNTDVITGYKFTVYSATNTITYNVSKTESKTDYQVAYEESGSVDDKTEGLPIYGGDGNNSYLIINVPSGTFSNRRHSVSDSKPYVVSNTTSTGYGDVHSKAGFILPSDSYNNWVGIYWIESGEYKWQVELTDENGDVALSREYYFTCYKTISPTISGDNIVSGVEAVFSGDYPIKLEYDETSYYPTPKLINHRFILEKDGTVLSDTGEIYSKYMRFEYGMFLSGDYTLKLKTECEGKITEEAEHKFAVAYGNAPSVNAPKAITTKGENSVTVDFSGVINISGNVVGGDTELNYLDIDGDGSPDALALSEGGRIFWKKRDGISENLDIPDDEFTLDLMVNLPYGSRGDSGVIACLSGDEGTLSVMLDEHRLKLLKNGVLISSQEICDESEDTFLPINTGDTVSDDVAYYFDFSENAEHSFNETDKYMLQIPMNVGWWLIRVTADNIRAKRITEETALNVEQN